MTKFILQRTGRYSGYPSFTWNVKSAVFLPSSLTKNADALYFAPSFAIIRAFWRIYTCKSAVTANQTGEHHDRQEIHALGGREVDLVAGLLRDLLPGLD